MASRRTCIIVTLVVLILAVFAINFYFVYYLNNEEANRVKGLKSLEKNIYHKVRHLHSSYLNRNPLFFMYRNKLLRNYKPAPYENASVLWDIVNWWPQENDIFPMYDTSMGQLIHTLQEEPITKASNFPRGTQLKLILKLANQQKVLFKPSWYPRTEIIEGPVYSGKDRHNAEIYAFYMAAVLDLRWTPIAVGRKVSLEHLYEVGSDDLKNTMTVTENEESENGTDTEYCVYGKCHYCNEDESVCGDDDNMIEGVILYMVPGQIGKKRSPWQRSYKDNVKAPWEDDLNYCKAIKEKTETTRILDMVDISIFDFLMQNGDRHHYEVREDRLLLMDNGKAFGNPSKDFLDILAPLYQCCLLRKSTWERLQVFSGGTLTDLVDRLSKGDLLYPLITDKHKRAIERRLLVVYAVVEICIDRYGEKILKT